MANLVEARWVGPAGYQLFDGTILGPGVTVEMTRGEAQASDNWEIVDKTERARAEKAAAKDEEST